jgi:hypothetical protein
MIDTSIYHRSHFPRKSLAALALTVLDGNSSPQALVELTLADVRPDRG